MWNTPIFVYRGRHSSGSASHHEVVTLPIARVPLVGYCCTRYETTTETVIFRLLMLFTQPGTSSGTNLPPCRRGCSMDSCLWRHCELIVAVAPTRGHLECMKSHRRVLILLCFDTHIVWRDQAHCCIAMCCSSVWRHNAIVPWVRRRWAHILCTFVSNLFLGGGPFFLEEVAGVVSYYIISYHTMS